MTAITLYLDNPVGMRLHDDDGNVWSTVTNHKAALFECCECGKALYGAYYTQRDGVQRFLCPEHVTLDFSAVVTP